MAARRNSSRAPQGPRNRNRSRRRMRLRCAKEHLDLLPLAARDGVRLGLGDLTSYIPGSSWMLRGTFRAGVFGEQMGLSVQALQSYLLAR